MSTTPRKNRRQKTSLLSKARWAGYAAAGAATALGTYEAADAGITYVNIEPDKYLEGTQVPSGGTKAQHAIDLPGGAASDLVMSHHFTPVSGGIGGFIGYAYANSWGNSRLAKIQGVQSGTFYIADRLGYGDWVSREPQKFFDVGTLAAGADPRWNFTEAGTGYIGFKFNVGGDERDQYGWLQVKMYGQESGHSFEILDYAYGDPGESIFAGQMESVPEPGSLGLLAVGGIGLLLWRRKRRKSQVSA